MKLSLTPEAMRVKIAEACGWTKVRTPMETGRWMTGVSPKGDASVVPKYPEDLNACHEMEKLLTKEQRIEYCYKLMDQPDWTTFTMVTTTALQRCEAFIATLGLADGTEGEK